MVEVGLATLADLFGVEFVDGVEGGDAQPKLVRLGAEGTHAGRDIEDGLALERGEIQREVAAIFIQRASEQNNLVQNEALLHGRELRQKIFNRRAANGCRGLVPQGNSHV